MEPEISLTVEEGGGRAYGLSLQGNWNVGSRLTLMADVEAEWEDDVMAWSSNESFARGEDGWLIGAEAESPEGLGPDDYVPFDDQNLLDALFTDIEPFDAEGHYFAPVFGTRDTRSVDFTVRSSITFTRNFSLQLYGQLFVARGRYDQFQILQDRDTLVPFEAFPKRDDFAFSSFQANTV